MPLERSARFVCRSSGLFRKLTHLVVFVLTQSAEVLVQNLDSATIVRSRE
jgi:hypothetical protein